MSDVEVTIGFIDAVRKEKELKMPKESYFRTYKVLATDRVYTVTVEQCDPQVLAAVLAETKTEHHERFQGSVSWMNAAIPALGLAPNFIADLLRYLLEAGRPLHFFRYGAFYAIADGDVQIVFDNEEPPVGDVKH